MRGLAFVAGIAAVPLLGWGLVPRRAAAWLPRPSGVAVAAGLGALALSVEMLAMSFLGIRWTAARVAAIPLMLTTLRFVLGRRASRVGVEGARAWPRPSRPAAAAIAAGLFVCAYAALTARATSADLLLFWGAKAERFASAGRIDVAFLKDPYHWGLHTDYPPLLPSLWAFASLCAGRFAWGGSLATLPIFAGYLVLAAWGLARLDLDERGAAASAALVAALLAAVLPVSQTAGNADPLLLFFESTALFLMTFGRGRPGAAPLAGAMLAAGVLTKFEGTFFAAAVVAASLLARRPSRWRDAAMLAAFPAAALLSWLVFCRSRHLFTYLGRAPRLYLDSERLAIVGRGLVAYASYGAAYAPWILAAALLLLRRPSGERLGFALGAAAFTLAADALVYLTSPEDPTLWLGWSASRLLLTPLFCLYAAAIAAPASSLGRAEPSRSSRDRTRTAASALPPA
jgi:hypothetical protein